MDSNFSEVAQSYEMSSQAPLDSKSMENLIADLTNLGANNNKAFTYYRGMLIFAHETKVHYMWTDVISDNDVKLLPVNFTYPNGAIFDNQNYSGLEFNFIKIDLNQININKKLIEELSILVSNCCNQNTPPVITSITFPNGNCCEPNIN